MGAAASHQGSDRANDCLPAAGGCLRWARSRDRKALGCLGKQLGRDLAFLTGLDTRIETRGRGFLHAVEIRSEDDAKINDAFRQKLLAACEENGMLFYPAGFENNRIAIVVAPPLTIPEADIARIPEVLESSIMKVLKH